jgi:nucleotide-binding universal stress UspA family protein
MISKILVAMDGSESSLKAYQYASFLAKQCDAALLIVNIFDTFERISSKIKQELGEIAKQIEAEGGTAVTVQILDDYKFQAKDSGIKEVKIVRREGNAAAEILQIADEEKVNTIVIGSTGINTVKEFRVGGVSHKIVHHAKCPVTVVRKKNNQDILNRLLGLHLLKIIRQNKYHSWSKPTAFALRLSFVQTLKN